MEKEQRNIEETLEQKKKQLPGIFMQDIQIRNLIYVIRGRQVMMDSDLADLYQVETKVFNQAVKRNIARFPEAFRFQLTYEEYMCLRSQIVTSNGSADASIVLIDNRSYHIGASLKDAGKRCFAVSRLEDVGMTKDILRRLEQGKNC
ncbi:MULTISPECIES: ORF6N domain-containing protein [Hungatella]|nr:MULTISPECIES: ORF6N domain-containing protein [Hungatella]MCQ4830581.1 ORF6N domain-containing protein [Hungatella sp. SL.1.14]CUQ55888.1 ORF6N domain [Hungatella hathewayi]